jgi:hypothetical protein
VDRLFQFVISKPNFEAVEPADRTARSVGRHKTKTADNSESADGNIRIIRASSEIRGCKARGALFGGHRASIYFKLRIRKKTGRKNRGEKRFCGKAQLPSPEELPGRSLGVG